MESLLKKKQKKTVPKAGKTTDTRDNAEKTYPDCDVTNAPVEIRDIGSIGNAVFATQQIPAGSCFLTEEPLFVIPKRRASITPHDLNEVYMKASKEEQRHSDSLRSRLDVPDRYDAELAAGVKLMPGLIPILKIQFNSGGCPAGTAIYDTVCRSNHSCAPNIEKQNFGTSKMTCWALETSRRVYYMTTAERREGLPRMKNPFVCRCGLCIASPEKRMISDLRRHIMRYLYTAIHRFDPAPILSELDVNKVREQIFAQTSSWVPTAVSTMMSYLLATLADLEGVAVVCNSSKDYAWAAVQLMDFTKDMGMNHLTPASNARFWEWVNRSKELAAISSGFISEDTKC